MIPETMICAECQRQGLKSLIIVPAVGVRLATLRFPAYYDENGTYHRVQDDKTTLEWECSQGHRWTTVE